jgi:hypothetical protein
MNKTINEIYSTFRYSNWSYLPNVITSGHLKTMSKKEIELQERWFEIFSSEQYYLDNLEILNNTIKKRCAEILEIYDLNLLFTQYIDEFVNISTKYLKTFYVINYFKYSIILNYNKKTD